MKKKLLILAVAGFALASCSSDETVNSLANSEANEINFRPLMTGVTRTAYSNGPISSFDTGDAFNVYASYKNAKYFQANFQKQAGSTFTSTPIYYWPGDLGTDYTFSEYNTAFGTTYADQSAFESAVGGSDRIKKMTFTAIFSATQKVDNPGIIEDFSPASSAGSQVDVLVAKTEVTSDAGTSGVPLTFYHALSQVIVKVKNTNADLNLAITDVMLGQVTTNGTFTYTGNGSAKVARTDWGAATSPARGSYTQSQAVNFTGTNDGSSDNAVVTLGSPWLIVPQVAVNTQEYNTANSTLPSIDGSTNPDIVGNFLALKMSITNHGNTISTTRWCCWPINQTFDPGYIYTFVIDAGSGGYQPVDTDNNKSGLDKVLPNAIVFSATCSIDPWVASGSDIPVNN